MKAENEEMSPGRRNFLMKLSLALGGLAAAAAGFPVFGALFQPLVKRERQTWRKVGRRDEFILGETRLVRFQNADKKPWAGTTANSAAWLRMEKNDQFIAFSANCTHLGCPVRWESEAELFMCPCHGGVYYKDGSVAAGPPPKPLVRYQVRLRNGQVEIRTAPVPITPINA